MTWIYCQARRQLRDMGIQEERLIDLYVQQDMFPEKKLYLFDTFEGADKKDISDPDDQ